MSRAVIKAGEARIPTHGAYSLDLRDISRRADAMIAAARDEVERMVAAARSEAEAVRQEIEESAYRASYEKGLAEGRAAGQAEALREARERFAQDQASLAAMMGETVRAFEGRREQLYLSARRDVVVLAIAVARRVLAKLPELGEAAIEAAMHACAEALDLTRGATEILVRAHPDDCRSLERLAEEVARTTQASKNIRMVEDASVGRGGVIVETSESEVDARASARVERIADELVTDWRARAKTLSLEK